MPTMSTKPDADVEPECEEWSWKSLPEHILLQIFSYLTAQDLAQAGLVCKVWLRVAFDELLWKDLFYRHWGVSRSIVMAPGKYSWIQEYKRLLYHTPSVESEVLKQHTDQVLHVSFSHNGKMFATCSKDGFIRVWDAAYPTSIKYKADMRKFTWKYTQYSQFNSTDSLLLVSGVHFGSLSTSGEIAVFSLDGEFVMQSRMINKPYDVFGTWYNDYYLLSGNLHWTGHLNSCSAIWLNKAYQETGSEEESVVMRLFKFSNINASSIRTIMVANCLEEETRQTPTEEKSEDLSSKENQSLIDEQLTNQEDDEMQEMEPNKPLDPKEYEMEASKPKTSKSLQGIQVFENGEFITKYLEVDPDVPNDKLNCTIEYSNDYRQAQSPKKRLLQRPCGYHSDTNDNLPASEISEQSNNGHSSTDSFDQRQLLSEIETASRPGSSRSQTEDMQTNQPFPTSITNQERMVISNNQKIFMPINRSEDLVAACETSSSSSSIAGAVSHSDVELPSHGYQGFVFTSNKKKVKLPNVPFDCGVWRDNTSEMDIQEVPLDSRQLNRRKVSGAENNVLNTTGSSSDTAVPFNVNAVVGESHAEALFAPDTGQQSLEASTSSVATSSLKRTLHGQQQQQGEICRDPRTCDSQSSQHSCDDRSESNDDLGERKINFCCVDYKKKKVNPIRMRSDYRFSVEKLNVAEEKMDAQKVETSKAQSDLSAIAAEDSCLNQTRQNPSCSQVTGFEADLKPVKPKIETGLQNESKSSKCTTSCAGKVTQSRLCLGSANLSQEEMDTQSVSDILVNNQCLPVRTQCHNQSAENSAAVSVPTATVRPRPNIFDIEIPERHYKTRKSGNGKCKKIKDKYLIFTKGSETYTPHQIGIKRIKPFQALGKDGSRLLPNVTETTYNNEQAGDTYDEVDHLIDMHGHIIGMTLSPDHRYLYVNSRPWPKNYFIENPLYPPPIASEIDIHVIDLLNMREVGTMHRAHKAYTSNDECFFIFLDVCEEYVASGAEDKHGYLWDRHYGLCLHKYLHTDVVNSVAFNPADPEVLVTVSDDFSIKIWRSLSREKEVVKAFNREHSIRLKHVQAMVSDTASYPNNDVVHRLGIDL